MQVHIHRTVVIFALKARARLSFCFSDPHLPQPLSATLNLEEGKEGWNNEAK